MPESLKITAVKRPVKGRVGGRRKYTALLCRAGCERHSSFALDKQSERRRRRSERQRDNTAAGRRSERQRDKGPAACRCREILQESG